MEEQQPNPIPNEGSPSLVLLKILCVLSVFGSGLYVIFFGFTWGFYEYFSNHLTELAPKEQDREVLKMIMSAGRLHLLLNAILSAISVIGAILLWNKRKLGFHLYTTSQLLLLILLVADIKGFPNPLFNITLTLLFIWGYSGFLKFMK